ncbi:uncharacterized protein [Triticum aestivum]|uniref:uncharacterized protein n=1 Tax=Triticum aestivum TaxID=4565 RepID=UPI001D027FD5|nr:uncharacterized protein LOC123038954 [Triticum aestivum]
MDEALAHGVVLADAPGSPPATGVGVNDPGAAARALRRDEDEGEALARDQVLANAPPSPSAALVAARNPGAAGSRRRQNGAAADDEVLAEAHAQASSSATQIVLNSQAGAAKTLVHEHDEVLAEAHAQASSSATQIVLNSQAGAAKTLVHEHDEAQLTKADALAEPSVLAEAHAQASSSATQIVLNSQAGAAKTLVHEHDETSSELFETGSKTDDEDVLRQSRDHSVLALAYFTEAKRFAPRCIVTPVFRGNELMCLAKLGELEKEVLHEIKLPFDTDVASVVFLHANGFTDRIADIQSEFVHASTMIDPDGPARHNIWYDIRRRTRTQHGNKRRTKHASHRLEGLEKGYQLIHSSPKDNITKARAEASDKLHEIMGFVCDQFVPTKVEEILRKDVAGDLAAAREEAKNLAATYGYCARARMLEGYVELKHTTTVGGPQFKAMLRELIRMVHEAAAAFKGSIIIAKFLAELYSALDQDEYAASVLRRALLVHNPDDPHEHDVPVGCTKGDCSEHRIATVQDQHREMLTRIEANAKCHPTDLLKSEEDVTEVDNGSPVNGKGKKKKTEKKPAVHHAFRYSQKKKPPNSSRIPVWEDWLRKNRTTPTAPSIPPIHVSRSCLQAELTFAKVSSQMVQQELVPEYEVNLYVEYCQALAQCSKKNFINNHYRDEHSLSLEQTFNRPEKPCNIGLRSYGEFRRHHYFVHRLTPGWWKPED